MPIVYALIARKKSVLAEYTASSDADLKRRIAFAYLEDIKTLWREKYSQIEQTAIAFSVNEEFSPILQQRIDYFSLPDKTLKNEATLNKYNDNLSKVQKQIDDVKEVMVENIDKVMQRGEKIELLVDRSEQLNYQAKRFEKSSTKLKDTLFWRRIKYILISFFAAAIVAVFISMLACGFTYDKCRAS